MNLLHLFFSVGAFLAPFVIGQLVAAGLNWRLLMVVSGIAALGLAVRLFALGMPSGRHVASRDSTHSDVITRAERSLLPFTALAIGICIYVAEEVSVSNWVVKFLSSVPEATATIVLSVYWGGLSLGRLLSSRLAERVDYTAFTVTCIVLTSTTLILAVLVPIFPLSATLFGLAGLFSGPIYPMIMAIGGNIYPHRLARLGGSLGASAVVGTLIYPPLIGLAASRYGLGTGLVGAGLLGFLGALAVALAVGAARRMRESGVGSAAGVGE